MIVIFNVDSVSYKKIKDLIEKGAYSSIENFIEIAVLNQIQLESSNVTTIGKIKECANAEETPDSKDKSRSHFSMQVNHQSLAVPKGAKISTLPPIDLSDEIKNTPVWGQINRFAPVKFALRLLLDQIVRSGNERIDLKSFSAYVAEKGTVARSYIEKKDKAHRVRGGELYVAFPKKDPKSQQRFITFYVGKTPSGKWTDGVLTGLSFARIEQEEDGSILIGLTEAGKQFAYMHSTLIDELLVEGKQIENSFSPDEVNFLLNHLRVFRPTEFEFLLSVLKFVREGFVTPTTLRSKVLKFLQEKRFPGAISDKVANTMQVGAIGRLVEINLLEIKKDAQRSNYALTKDGETLLNRGIKL